ncbi:MAG: zinc-ribbon domain-containing protein [Candidatus Thorarchaeota archaeon]
MSSHKCPECGRQLKPNASFCSYCGVSLKQRKPTDTGVQGTKIRAQTVQVTEQATDVESIPPAVEAALILRGKLETLRSQKVALDEELETVKVKQLVGELSENEANKQTEKLQARLSPITKEIEELESKAQTPLEQLHQEKKIQEGRLQRLEELKNTKEVDEAIYNRLSSEYRNKHAEIDQQLQSEISKANRWLAHLENRKQQLEFDRETLQIRARIDEVSKQDVKKQLQTIDDEITKLTSVIAGLRSILGSEARTPKPVALKQPWPSKAKKPRDEHVPGKCPHCNAQITPGTKYCYTCGRLITG